VRTYATGQGYEVGLLRESAHHGLNPQVNDLNTRPKFTREPSQDKG
jgi:hypothetical protein